MTGKRFTLAYEKGNWWAVRDGDITLWKEEVIYLLNELHEENKQFKKALRVAYSTNLTEPTKNTIEQIAKYCGVDLE